METCWLPTLDVLGIEAMMQAMETAVSPGCAIFTHEFKGAASRVPLEAMTFGLRREHVLVEILASFVDRSDRLESKGIATGFVPLFNPSAQWRFPVVIRTFSLGKMRTV